MIALRGCALAALVLLAALPARADLVRLLEQDPESGIWRLSVEGWSATLSPEDPDAMTASLALAPETGAAMTAPVDMMGPNLPDLVAVDDVLACGDQPATVVTLADLVARQPEGGESGGAAFVYRRYLFTPADGYLGVITDTASAQAGGALPAAVVAEAFSGICKAE